MMVNLMLGVAIFAFAVMAYYIFIHDGGPGDPDGFI